MEPPRTCNTLGTPAARWKAAVVGATGSPRGGAGQRGGPRLAGDGREVVATSGTRRRDASSSAVGWLERGQDWEITAGERGHGWGTWLGRGDMGRGRGWREGTWLGDTAGDGRHG